MSSIHGQEAPPTLDGLDGELAFASPEAQVQRTAELLGDGVLVVHVPPMPPSRRGRLAEHVDERIEHELGLRGAPSPYLAAWSAMPEDAEARIADQLFRARTVGASGIAIALGTLASAASPALAPEDTLTLRLLARACTRASFYVLLDDADLVLSAYADPVPLTDLLGAPALETRLDAIVAPAAQAEAATAAPPSRDLALDADPDVPVTIDEEVEPPAPAPPRSAATAGIPVAGASDEWRQWALALGAVRGPQPLAAFERLFVDSYVPLANAIAEGLDDARAIRAYEEFRRSFERAYGDAFQTFGATNRRPRLVMDVYDFAAKQARLHNARTSHVLVVDSLRYDLGVLVRDAIAQRAPGATLTAETLLFAALPTTTLRQLETLARGLDALRAPASMEEQQLDSLRGRSADTVRRLRVGSRELYKLDSIPAALATIGERLVAASFDDVAENVADVVARHVETLPPRTLLVVLGDHGFCVDRRGRITCGGASPEEVLVPAFAYLVGELH